MVSLSSVILIYSFSLFEHHAKSCDDAKNMTVTRSRIKKRTKSPAVFVLGLAAD
jgi:hypothetical protein